MVPRRAHIQGKLGQGIESIDVREQKAFFRVTDSYLFAHDILFKFILVRLMQKVAERFALQLFQFGIYS